MIINTKTAPVEEPITLNAVKDHLRITNTDHDDILNDLIKASREHIEKITGRALVERTLEVQYESFHNFRLPYPPVISVDSIEYTDTDGVTKTVDNSLYSIVSDSYNAVIVLKYGESWPAVTLNTDEFPIKITYNAGYEPSGSPLDYQINIPSPIKSALKMHVEILFDRPQQDYTEKLQGAINALLAPYTVRFF